MTVYFENVGHSNANFTRECKKELTYEWLYRQVKPYCMSRNLDFSYDEETGEGLIFGGFQTIGRFRIENENPA